MKPATRAPMFACLYPGLCDVARNLGYALAIHGTLDNDLDLIAVPWTNGAVEAEVLRDALLQHVGACLGAEMHGRADTAGTVKPHGRVAWNLYMDHGTKIDLSVLPRKTLVAPYIGLPLPWTSEPSTQETPPSRKSATIFAADSTRVCQLQGPFAALAADAIVSSVNSNAQHAQHS